MQRKYIFRFDGNSGGEQLPNLSDIEDMLRGSGDLRQRIVRNLGSSTVALFAVFDSHGSDLLLPQLSVTRPQNPVLTFPSRLTALKNASDAACAIPPSPRRVP
jgi:hypothetical protein